MTQLLSKKIYYGWYIVFVLAITTTLGYGILYYAFTVMMTPMETDLGWSRGEINLGFSISLLVWGLMAYPVGWWVDKYGARLLMTSGSVLGTLCIIAWAQVTNLWIFYIIWFGIGLAGAMILYEPAFAVIATWFREKRSTALTIVTFAGGFASTIFLPLTDYLLITLGWRQAIIVLGIIFGLLTIPLTGLIIRHRPSDLGTDVDGLDDKTHVNTRPEPNLSVSDAIRSRFFWMLTLGFFIAGFGAGAIRVHSIPIFVGLGLTSTAAAFASGSIGILQVVGRVIFIPLDRFMSGRIMLAGLFAMQAIAILALALGFSPIVSVSIFVGFFGASVGMRTLVRPSILADTFGSTNYGRISSLMALPLTISGTTSPFIAGVIYDRFQNYDVLINLTVASKCTSSHSANNHPNPVAR
ncbi:MAG: MFS transporter, partial [Chloroflexota bacterium]